MSTFRFRWVVGCWGWGIVLFGSEVEREGSLLYSIIDVLVYSTCEHYSLNYEDSLSLNIGIELFRLMLDEMISRLDRVYTIDISCEM